MGTRADFYIRNEKSEIKMEWLGSIAWDGYEIDGVEKATTEEDYRRMLAEFFATRDDVTLPEQGWPWPWDDSETTDYAYIFDAQRGKVLASTFGSALYDPKNADDEAGVGHAGAGYFPNMKDKKNVQWGNRSGIVVITGK